MKSLDDLLHGDEPHATFHDALVQSINVDYVARRLVAHIDLWVGDPDNADAVARERRRAGTLVIEGLKIWVLEPSVVSGNALWLTSDGPLNESPTQAGKAFATHCGPGDVAWFLFFNDVNAFGYLAGASATFAWSRELRLGSE